MVMRDAAPGAPECRPPAILVVDDDEGVRDALTLMLEDDYEITVAADGLTALELIRTTPLNLVLLDVVLPTLDGLEVLERIKEIKPDLPVIVVTGLGLADPAATAMKMGAFDYVTKPLEEDALLSLIRSALETGRLATPATPPKPPAPKPNALGSILLIGRDVPVLASLRLLLEPRHATIVRRTASEVAQYLVHGVPMLVLLDDSTDRYDLIGIVKRFRFAFRDCGLIIGCTVPWDAGLLKEVDHLHPDAIVPKPYDVNGLLHWMRVVLARRRVPIAAGRPLSLYIKKAIDHVCHHYRTTTLETAANASGVSSSYLSRLFPAEFGMSFWGYVTAVRVEAAKALLAETTHKLEHIANLVGFSDAAHLSRVFERHTSQSPGGYRRSMLGIAPRMRGRKVAG